jgi:hypothetical protein
MFIKSPVETAGVQYCVNWLYSRATALGMTVGASVSIAVVNILLSVSMRSMTIVEGHHSIEDLEKSLVLRLFLAQFLNTAILAIIINAAWDTITGQSLPIPNTGKYEDFTSGWYNTVGVAFHSTMITLAISPHVGTLMGLWSLRGTVAKAEADVAASRAQHEADGDPANADKAKLAKKLRRKAPPPSFKLQDDYDEAMVGAPADYVLRYVQMLTTVYVCYVFSAGMPLLMPIAAVSLTVSYAVDKLAFLRLHRRPPSSTNRMALYIIELLPLCILLHLAVGVWMLGSLSSFRDALLALSGMGDTLAYMQQTAAAGVRSGILRSGLSRVTQVQSIPLLVLFAVVLGGLLLRIIFFIAGSLAYTALNIISCGKLRKVTCCRVSLEDPGTEITLYTTATKPGIIGTQSGIVGIHSYNVLMSPQLQALFGIDSSFAETHKGLGSLASFSPEDAVAAARARRFLINELSKTRAIVAAERRVAKHAARERSKRMLLAKESGQDKEPTAEVAVAAAAAEDNSGAFAVANPLHEASAASGPASPMPKTARSKPALKRTTSMRVRASDYVVSSNVAEAADRIARMLRQRLASARATIAARRSAEAAEGHQVVILDRL